MNHNSVLIFSSLLLFFASCVGPAANKAKRQYGVTPKEINKCVDKTCFNNLLIKYESKILKSDVDEFGNFYEIYRVRKERGSYLRSFIHAILTVGTLGLWNVVGYPLEGFVSDDKYLVFKVTYDEFDIASKVEIQGGK
ncbi:MAG: hypothetical protein GTO02_14990 [Candidatus Dadabacteria bacterium]|nr:hypothetical protein [Candidatus Dadabacteria bacterium]NIQ15647.1 hypothetical protein [Candidatus Dadabacteria bacterium]